MPGPKPKPTSLKKVQGTFRKDRAPENEPAPGISENVPVCPEWYPETAKAFWAVFAAKFHAAGLLTEVDEAFFGAGALAYAFMMDAAEDLSSEGIRIKGARQDGDRVKNPSFQIFRDSYGMFAKWCASFGATPADRSRVSVASPEEEPDGVLRMAV